ncbi:MAG: CxxC-x17-CxxC domain-containing protein [Candidatus Omnitrophota bacterium]
MKRKPKQEDVSALPQAKPDIAVFMVKIQHQLMALEKKIDSLISQSQERPPQRFEHFRHREKRDQGNSYGERRFTKAICAECHKECEVPFKPSGDRPVYCKECFSRRKQGGSFRAEYGKGPAREGDFTQREHSDKKPGRKSQGRGGRKPVFRRRRLS